MSATAVLTAPASGPYRYLDYFQESDRATFAGREEDVAEVSARMSADEPFVLYARSGLGKTSLLLAGVFPILRERRLFPVHVRIIDNPVLDLRNAIATALERPCGVEAIDLDRLLASAGVIGSVVLVFDQFEEFFINLRHKPAVRRDFIHRIAALILRSHGDVRVTFSLREDYLAELDEFREAFPQILSNQYRLQPLSAFGARQAIVAPLVASGIEFDQRLVVRLVDMLAEVGFDPVLLQIACGEVYREAIQRNQGASLTEADLDKVGGIEGLFERYLDNAIARVPKNQLLLCRAMLDALTTSEETKRAVTFDALLHNDDFQASPEEIQSVLDCLKQQKLIRPDLRGETLFYELSHDRLAPSVVKWFKQDPDFSRFRDARGLIADTTRRAALPDRLESLITAAQITKLIGPYRQRLKLTPQEREVMFWSAVYSRVEDVEFWCDLVGTEKACQALQRLFTLESTEARLGAAVAAVKLAAAMPDLKAPCLKAALQDSDKGVRAAAARALAYLAGDEEIAALRTALGSRRTRSRALDVLAAFVGAGPIEKFGRYWRVRARLRARRRALAQHREAIWSRTKRGAMIAPLAAIGWTATIGACLMCLLSWVNGELHWVVRSFYEASIFGAGAAFVSALLGWFVARMAATQAAIRGREGAWMALPWRTALTVGMIGLALIVLSDPEQLLGDAGGVLLGAVAVPLVVGIVVRLFRASIWPPAATTRPARIAWSLLVGLPLAVPVMASEILLSGGIDVSTFTLVFAAAPTIMALVLSESAAAFPIGSFPPLAPRRRMVTRAVLVLAAVALPGFILWSVGMDSIPFFSKSYALDKDVQIPLPLASNHADSVYFTVESNDSQWVTLDYPNAITLRADNATLSSYTYGERGHLLAVPRGRHQLSATATNGSGEGLSLKLTTIPLFDVNAVLPLDPKAWTMRLIRLDEFSGDGQAKLRIWKADVKGRTQGWPLASVRILFGGSGSGFGELSQSLPGQATREESTVRVPAVPGPWAQFEFPLSAVSRSSSELKPIPIEADGSFGLTLTYRLPADSQNAPPQNSSFFLPVLLSVEPSVDARVKGLYDLAVRLSQANRRNESIDVRRQIVALKPNDANALNGLAWELLIARRGGEALEPARTAARQSMRIDANILDTLAHAEYEAGNLNEARQAWEDTLKLDPSYYSPPSDDYCKKDLELIDKLRKSSAAPAPAPARR
jgi:hypothetical protein